MARPRSPNRDKAFKIYKRYGGKIRNKEIAEILGADEKTVSKWKSLDKWVEKVDFSKEDTKNFEGESSSNAKKEEETLNVSFEKELNEIQEIQELNEKQTLFCIYYIQCFNATKAYQKAYSCKKTTAMVNGCNLLSNPNIQATIEKLRQNRLNRAMLKPEDIFQKYMDIAFADITDYITFGKMDVEIGEQTDGTKVYQKVNYIEYKDSDEVDGTLITEFKEGKNGFSIKLKDSLRALEWLSNHMDMATEEQKARVEVMRQKQKLAEERFEHEKDIDSKRYW